MDQWWKKIRFFLRHKDYISWRELENAVWRIQNWANDKNFTAIYGIPRGGLVPAVLLSYRMGIPLLLTKSEVTKNTLVVDDICDTGQTMAALEREWGFSPSLATIYFKENPTRKPDFFWRRKKKWVVFPWETEEGSTYNKTKIS